MKSSLFSWQLLVKTATVEMAQNMGLHRNGHKMTLKAAFTDTTEQTVLWYTTFHKSPNAKASTTTTGKPTSFSRIPIRLWSASRSKDESQQTIGIFLHQLLNQRPVTSRPGSKCKPHSLHIKKLFKYDKSAKIWHCIPVAYVKRTVPYNRLFTTVKQHNTNNNKRSRSAGLEVYATGK